MPAIVRTCISALQAFVIGSYLTLLSPSTLHTSRQSALTKVAFSLVPHLRYPLKPTDDSAAVGALDWAGALVLKACDWSK